MSRPSTKANSTNGTTPSTSRRSARCRARYQPGATAALARRSFMSRSTTWRRPMWCRRPPGKLPPTRRGPRRCGRISATICATHALATAALDSLPQLWPRVGRRERAEIQRAVAFDLLVARHLRRIPAAAQRLDQGDAGNQAALAHGQRGLGVCERRGLCDDDSGIGNRTGLVLIVEDALGLARGSDRDVLGGGLLGQDAQRGELVLDLLEPTQHDLPVIGDRGIEGGAVLLDHGVAGAGVENRLVQGRTDRPDPARRREQLAERRRGSAVIARQRDGRKERR